MRAVEICKQKYDVLNIIFHPIEVEVNNSLSKRLPKKGIKSTKNIKDKYSKLLSKQLPESKKFINFETDQKFSVQITIYNGSRDRLGTGDLDNYSKAIMDIITRCNSVWKDDKYVDKLFITRKYISNFSKIKTSIKII